MCKTYELENKREYNYASINFEGKVEFVLTEHIRNDYISNNDLHNYMANNSNK